MGLFRPAGAVGLELDAGEVRAVELGGTGRAPRVISWGRESLPEGTIVDGTVVHPEAVASALEKLWSSAGFSTRDVVLGIANQGVLIRLAAVPKVPENRLAQLIRYQAQDYLPIPLAQAVLDFAVVGQIAGENGLLTEVLLVAAKRDMLDNFLEALTTARLNPVVVDCAPLALARAVKEGHNSGTVAMVEIGYGMSHIVITADGLPRFARLIAASLQEAEGRFGCPLNDVAPVDEAVGGVSKWFDESFRNWCDALAVEISSSIGYYLAQPGSGNVEKVVLSGRGSRVAGITRHLGETLALPVVSVDVLEGLAVTPSADAERFQREAADFTVCIGLSRRRLGGAK